MINYEDMTDLRRLSRKDKLKIVKREIEKIINVNELQFNALKYDRYSTNNDLDCYIFASNIIAKASLNIRKMFPY